jgi:hypothetical protein
MDSEVALAQAGGHWDLSWTDRIKGKRRAVFDVPVIEDGYGVWRAGIWRHQYSQVFNIAESSLATVLVLRHDAVVLALNNDYWQRYGTGETWKVKDPATGQPTSRNPVIERTGEHALPPQFAGYTLEALMTGGVIVLACSLALRDAAQVVARQERVSGEEAEKRVRDMMVPGVILQPSGVFAVVLAQDHGCRFVRAS